MTKVNIEEPFLHVTDCAAHSGAMDEDCEHCKNEFEAKNAALSAITEYVQGEMKGLLVQGVQVPPDFVANVRLELLIEATIKERSRLHFEAEVTRRILVGVQEAQKEATLRRIGGSSKGGLVVPTTGRVR